MLVAFPTSPVPAKVDWSIEQPSQSNRSEITSRRRSAILGAAPRWSAKVQMPEIRSEPNAYAWRAFAVELNGVVNSFRLVACERDQITGIAPRVKGAGQQGFSLLTDGWGSDGVKLRRGQFVTINDQLLMLMQDVVADAAGNALITFQPYIRVAPVDLAAIEVRRPYALMSSTDPKNGWSVGIGQEYGFSFDCEESF